MSIRRRIPLRAGAIIMLAASTASAQAARPQPARPQPAATQASSAREALKRTPLPSALLPVCPVARPTSVAPSDEQRRQARDLASRAQQAAILGDTAAALSRLRDAKALDPTDPDLAYQLARIYESGAASDSAVKEYCRYLTLAPNSMDAADARDRVSVLAKPAADPAIDAANALFRQALAEYDAGRMADADARFSRLLEAQPSWADAYYDRALVRIAEGDRQQAASDLEVYLRLMPSAPDRQATSARVEALRRARLSPGQAFALGIVVPGAGQFYTHRPAWGALLLLAGGGAVGYALAPQHKLETSQLTATDPFGNPYTYTSTRQVTDRPALVPGLAAAGGIAVIGAIEAAVYAGRFNGPSARRVSLRIGPSGNALGVAVAF